MKNEGKKNGPRVRAKSFYKQCTIGADYLCMKTIIRRPHMYDNNILTSHDLSQGGLS